MEINISNTLISRANNTISGQETSQQADSALSQNHSKTGTADRLTLSDAAGLIERTVAAATIYPASDPQRIAELKQEIGAGRFNIDSVRIAEKLQQFSINL